MKNFSHIHELPFDNTKIPTSLMPKGDASRAQKLKAHRW